MCPSWQWLRPSAILSPSFITTLKKQTNQSIVLNTNPDVIRLITLTAVAASRLQGQERLARRGWNGSYKSCLSFKNRSLVGFVDLGQCVQFAVRGVALLNNLPFGKGTVFIKTSNPSLKDRPFEVICCRSSQEDSSEMSMGWEISILHSLCGICLFTYLYLNSSQWGCYASLQYHSSLLYFVQFLVWCSNLIVPKPFQILQELCTGHGHKMAAAESRASHKMAAATDLQSYSENLWAVVAAAVKAMSFWSSREAVYSCSCHHFLWHWISMC